MAWQAEHDRQHTRVDCGPPVQGASRPERHGPRWWPPSPPAHPPPQPMARAPERVSSSARPTMPSMVRRSTRRQSRAAGAALHMLGKRHAPLRSVAFGILWMPALRLPGRQYCARSGRRAAAANHEANRRHSRWSENFPDKRCRTASFHDVGEDPHSATHPSRRSARASDLLLDRPNRPSGRLPNCFSQLRAVATYKPSPRLALTEPFRCGEVSLCR